MGVCGIGVVCGVGIGRYGVVGSDSIGDDGGVCHGLLVGVFRIRVLAGEGDLFLGVFSGDSFL